jgi:adenine-specific DNA-methyltransferase
MDMAHELANIEIWRTELGLLPVPLFNDKDNGQPYVLLNGAQGNFCLDLGRFQLGAETRNYAWSSNVGHYLVLAGNHIEVQRWDQKRSAVERYSYSSIFDNLEKFHIYLEKDAPRQDISVVSHVIRVFRSLRAIVGSISGSQSLKAFLYLLACATENVDRKQINLDLWQLDREAFAIAHEIRESDWDTLRSELEQGRPLESLVPNLTLLLRHASGQLFQEAHYEAVLIPSNQLMLEGFLPSPIKIDKERKSTGIHFTPPALARTLVEEALNLLENQKESLLILDPACGSGEFLREVLRQLKLRKYEGHIHLVGWDVSAAACDMARFVLAWESRDISESVTTQIQCIDSLAPKHNWPKNVDLVLMNPPFVSWQDMNATQRESVVYTLGALKEHRPDMSHAFILKASECLRNGGILGTILPASLLDGYSAENMRRQLSEQMSPRLIARLGSHLLFPGAMIDASLYVAKKDTAPNGSTVAFWADHRASSNAAGLRALRRTRYFANPNTYPIVKEGFSIYLSPSLGKDAQSWAPRPYDSWKLMQNLYHLPRVGQIFDVRQGVRTGHNKTFLLKKSEWLNLPENERVYFAPAVVNKSIQFGFLRDIIYIFYPYGKNRIESEIHVQQKLSNYYERYLLPEKDVLLARQSVNRDRWWELIRHRAWQAEERTAKIVSTYFGDMGSFAWDATGDFVIVQGFGWFPKKTKSNALFSRKIGFAYLSILNSSVFSELLSATSNHVGGGQWNLSKKFVDDIPMPDLFSEQVNPSVVSKLAIVGEAVCSGLTIDEKELTSLVNLLYGVDSEL